MPVSLQTIPIGGLHCDVYGLEELLRSPAVAVSVLFVLHGRLNVKASMDTFCRTVWSESDGKGERPLLVVNQEQRNHGTREIAPTQNQGFKTKGEVEGNPSHFVDMYATFTGSAQDVSFLIDFLPSVLFPSGAREVAQWLAAGSSLGGHAVWTLLATEPRITLGIPIIGCPDYVSLMSERMAKIPVPFAPPAVPSSLLLLINSRSPSSTPYTTRDSSNPFWGKDILVLAGSKDRLVPFEPHTRKFFDALEVGEGVKEKEIYDCGHEFTPEGILRAADFIVRFGLGKQSRL